MNFYKISNYIEYPVGLNMTKNLVAIKEMATRLTEVYPNKDFTLWCRGSSGSIIAGILSYLLEGYTIINHIKKEQEYSHSNSLSSLKDINRVHVIVDDLIASGTTISSILDKMTWLNINPDALCITGEYRRDFPIETIFALSICYKGNNYYDDIKFKNYE